MRRPRPPPQIRWQGQNECPERSAQGALGHNRKAVHRAYAKRALMRIPSSQRHEADAATQTSATVSKGAVPPCWSRLTLRITDLAPVEA